MRTYGLLSAVALTFFLCPSCDDRSERDRYDQASQRADHDYNATSSTYTAQTGATVGDRPYVETTPRNDQGTVGRGPATDEGIGGTDLSARGSTGSTSGSIASSGSAGASVGASVGEGGASAGASVGGGSEPRESDPMNAKYNEQNGVERSSQSRDQLGQDRDQLGQQGRQQGQGDFGRQTDTRERMSDTSGPFAKSLPEFTLQDPNGKSFNNQTLTGGGGIVLVVSAPTLMNGGDQDAWARALAEARGDSKGKIAFVEDMSQATFKDTARNEMKKDYDPSTGPVVLVDESGSLRSQLKVDEDRTVVLVYDADGRLIHSEQGKPSPQLAKAIWQKLDKKQ